MTTGPSEADRRAANGAGDAAARRAAAARLPERIAFLGFGLIGGSVALALRDAGCPAHLTAWTPNGAGPRLAAERNLLDGTATSRQAAIDGAQLVVLAGPPLAILETLRELAGPLRTALAADATITDVASTKGLIVALAEDLGLPFVGGHPMAGRETAGFGAATADLFQDRPWVVVAGDNAAPAHLDRVVALATATGARPVRMSAIDHDLAVAAVSHLPLIAAAALVEGVASEPDWWPSARALAASGWRDMTRLARGDVDMGAGILATNARPIAGLVRAYRDALDSWLVELEGLSNERAPAEPDTASVARLRSRLERARAALDQEP